MTKEWLLDVLRSKEFYVPIITVMISIIVIGSFSRIIKKLFKGDTHNYNAKKRKTVVILVNSVVRYFVIIIATIIILSSWGVNVSGIIAGLGVAGAVAGLALQDALKDIIMGINIIMDNYFVVGDIITCNGFTGTVVEFGLKTTKIKSADGITMIISNREITKIENMSYKDATIRLKIPVAYEEKEAKVKKTLERICKEMNEWSEVISEPEYLGIDDLSSSSVDYLITINTLIQDKWNVRRKALSYIKNEFDKVGIKIPYTQIEVHNGK